MTLCPLCGSAGYPGLHTFKCDNEACENHPHPTSAETLDMFDRLDAQHAVQAVPLPADVNEAYWHDGILKHLLDGLQQQFYDFWWGLPPTKRQIVALISRRAGKTFTCCCIAVEIALRKPGSLQHYAAMTTVQVRNMLIPTINTILGSCPPELRPKLLQRDNRYIWPNGSELVLAGCEDRQKCDRLRGAYTDCFWADEAGYIEPLNYLIQSVAMPMLHARPNAKITMYSNAPYSPAHDLIAFANRAKAEGTFFHATVYDSPRYTEADIRDFSEAAGGKDSAEWKREYLAEIVVDEEHAVIPEWTSREDCSWVQVEDSFRAKLPDPTDHEEAVMPPLVRRVERPQYYDTYTSIDLGWAPDLTSILSFYWDYLGNRLVIEDERELSKMTTDQLAEAIRDIEFSTWGDYWGFMARNHGKEPRPFLRIMDVNRQVQADLTALHNLGFTQANNHDIHSQINRLRQLVRRGGIVVHPRCTKLIAHLRAAYWDPNRKRFARPSKAPRAGELYYGHFDHLSALQLGYAHVVQSHDPYPAIPVGITPRTHMVHAPKKRNADPGLEALARMMRARRVRKAMMQ